MDNVPLLELLLDDAGRQSGVHRPGPYWERSARFAARAMRERGLSGFRSAAGGLVGQGYTDGVSLDPTLPWAKGSWPRRALKALVDRPAVRRLLYKAFDDALRDRQAHVDRVEGQLLRVLHEDRLVSSGLLDRLPDTLYGGCDLTAEIGGRTVSRHYLFNLFQLENLAAEADFSKARTVFEIGGGFGSNAHLLLHLYPNVRKYLYLDIPPMLYVGTQYLRHFYPDAVSDYAKTRSSESLAFSDGDELEILAIAPWQLDRVRSPFDVFYNSYSMQEMTPAVVANYAAQVKRLAAPQARLCLLTYDAAGSADGRLAEEDVFRHFTDRYDVRKVERCAVPMVGDWRRLRVLRPKG